MPSSKPPEDHFRYEACDIAPGMTLGEFRSLRSQGGRESSRRGPIERLRSRLSTKTRARALPRA
jgi:hypothetical protein